MEHKFGLFQTVEELNRAAAAQKAEGDTESLYALAAENGIEKDDVDDYLDGATSELCSWQMAVSGKLDLEAKELELKSQLMDWKNQIEEMALNDEKFARTVFFPEKKLQDVIAEGLKTASKARIRISRILTKAAGLPEQTAIGMISRRELQEIATRYYLGGDGK